MIKYMSKKELDAQLISNLQPVRYGEPLPENSIVILTWRANQRCWGTAVASYSHMLALPEIAARLQEEPHELYLLGQGQYVQDHGQSFRKLMDDLLQQQLRVKRQPGDGYAGEPGYLSTHQTGGGLAPVG